MWCMEPTNTRSTKRKAVARGEIVKKVIKKAKVTLESSGEELVDFELPEEIRLKNGGHCRNGAGNG